MTQTGAELKVAYSPAGMFVTAANAASSYETGQRAAGAERGSKVIHNILKDFFTRVTGHINLSVINE